MTVTVLLDNEPFSSGLMTDWGLSLLVEADGVKVLMDTGSSARKLFANASALGVKLDELDAIFISHWHGDHCGALLELLDLSGGLDVFAPVEPGWWMTRRLRGRGASLVVLRRPSELLPGLHSTGDLGGEHSLVADLGDLGLVVLTGCSHPGAENVIERACAYLAKRVYALMGGFHISSYQEGRRLGTFLARKGVRLVCPCHCTGSSAKRGLAEVLGNAVVRCGVGRRLEFRSKG